MKMKMKGGKGRKRGLGFRVYQEGEEGEGEEGDDGGEGEERRRRR